MVLGCFSGCYGENCFWLCFDYCFDNSCYIEIGFCFGCKEGYLGVICEKCMYSKLKVLFIFVYYY